MAAVEDAKVTAAAAGRVRRKQERVESRVERTVKMSLRMSDLRLTLSQSL